MSLVLGSVWMCSGAVTFGDFGLINGVPVFKVTGLAEEMLTVQRKAADESDWSDSTCRLLGASTQTADMKLYAFGAADARITGAANLSVSFRVSADAGETWSTFTYTPVDTLSGTAVTVGGTYASSPNYAGDKALDGNPLTWYEPNSDVTWPNLTRYFYIDLGSYKRITGIKVVPREGWTGSICRLQGCVVEVAQTADFVDAKRVCTVPQVNAFGVVTVPVETPSDGSALAGRFVRITCGERTEIFNVAELEVIGEDSDEPAYFRFFATLNRTPIIRAYILPDDAELEAQWKFACDADFASCTIRKLNSWNGVSYWALGAATEKIRPAFTVRLREKGTELWSELAIPASEALFGTYVGCTSYVSGTGKPGPNALDGDPFTYAEPSYVSGKQVDAYAWFGLDLGQRRTVTGCRVLSRIATTDWGTRVANRVMQVSDTADFSVIAASVTLKNVARLAIGTFTFDQPVRGRYVRISSNGIADVCNFGEVEFTTSETSDIADSPTLGASDLTNGYAVVSWASSALGYAYRDVYTSIAAGGPWTKVARVPVANGCWTNTAALLGVKAYYALANVATADADESLTGLSAPVAYIRSGRADRDLATDTLREGVVPFGARNIGGYGDNSKPARCFDGDITTYVDAKVNGNNGGSSGQVAIGVDLGADWVVTGFRYYPRYDSCKERIGNNYLWGVPHGQSELCSATRINPTATEGNVNNAIWREITSGFVALPIQRFFIYGNSLFYGNAGELEVYGYPLAAMADRLSVPEVPVLSCETNGIRATWTPCPAATGYVLERSTATTDWESVYSGTLPTCVDTSVSSGVAYAYRVKALQDTVYGYSQEVGMAYVAPSASPLSERWETASALGAGVTGAASVDAGTGTVTLRTDGGEVDCNGERGYGVWRTEKNRFTAACTVTVATNVAINGETCYLTVRAGAGEGQPFAAVGFRYMKSYDGLRFGAVAMRARAAANAAVTETTGWSTPVADLESAQLRLCVRESVVRGYWRTSAAASWQLVGTATFPEGCPFGARVRTGLLATVPVGAVAVPDGQWTVTDYTCEPMRGFVLTVR